MYQDLARRAIMLALENRWKEAVEINLRILDSAPYDLDALNRIAQAHVKLGAISEAQKNAQRVIDIDPLNSIAQKCIERCKILDGKNIPSPNPNNGSVLEKIFIEEPGKTKIVSLVNICEPSLIAGLNPGDQVAMLGRGRKVIITTIHSIYIGRLPDDVANRIIYLVNEGNDYTTHIKSVALGDIKVFIREVKKSQTMINHASFPLRR